MWMANLSNVYYKYFIIEWIIYIPCLLYIFFLGALYHIPFIPNQIEYISISLGLILVMLIVKLIRNLGLKRERFKLNQVDFWVACWFFYQFVSLCFRDSIISFEVINQQVAWGLLYVFIRNININQHKYILLLLLFVVILQILYSFDTQLHYFIPGKKLNQIHGTFFNVNLWGFYLSVTLICLLGGRYCFKTAWMKCIIYIFICLLVPFIILSNSRGAWLCCFIGVLYVLFSEHRIPKFTYYQKWLVYISISIFFFFLFSFLYYYKIDSTKGRLFIWKVSINMIVDNPIIGIGIDGFKRTYMLFQEDYFAKHPNSIYAFLADNNYFAFNEYLKIVVEQGVIGLLLVGGGIYSLFQVKSKEVFACTIKGVIISFLVFSLFSNPTSSFTIVSLIGCFVAMLASRSAKSLQVNYKCFLGGTFVINIIGILYFAFSIVPFMRSYQEWNKARSSYNYSSLKLIPNTIFIYHSDIGIVQGQVLNNLHEYTRANVLLETINQNYPSYFSLLELGKSYKGLKKYHEAELIWSRASKMVPLRFVPLYYLAKMNEERGEMEKAKYYAKIILEKKIKVMTPELHRILREMTILNNK